MPMAIPLIVGLAAQGIAYTGFGIAFGTLASAAIGAAASTAASLALSASAPDAPDLSSALNQAGAGRTQALRQPIAPHQIIAGRVKVSGIYVFVHTKPDDGGRANGHLYMVHAIAGHKVRAFGAFYFREDLTTDSAFGQEQVFWRITPHLGEADQAADSNMVAEIGNPNWGADHRLRGRAYLAILLYWSPDIWASGIPNISAIVEGVDDIYDPRTQTTGWHNNAALFIARWFTASWGMGLSWSDLNEASVIAAANICDERVRVKTTSTTILPVVDEGNYTDEFTLAAGARVLDVGDGVRLTTSGTLPAPLAVDTTYYAIPSAPYGQSDESVDLTTAVVIGIKLATTPANAIAGVAINITDGGSGTTTLLYWDEARYKLNGQWTLDAPKGQVFEQLLTAMAGTAVLVGGEWFLHAGAPATPTITLTADDLRGDLQWVPKRSMRDRFNGIRAVYVNPEANWQPVDAPPLQSEAYLEEDDEEELTKDVRYPFTISSRAVQRLQKIALEINRRQGTLIFPAKLSAMRLQVWDGAYVTLDRYGWEQKQFRVIAWVLAEDGGIDLTLQEDDAAVYAWDSSEERDSAIQQGLVLPDPSEIAAPASITVDTPVGPTFTHILATIAETPSIWLDGYDPEYREAGTTDWTGYGRVNADDDTNISVERSTAQDFRARSVTRNGTPSAFTENLAPAAPMSMAATLPGPDNQIELDAVFDADTISVQVFHYTADLIASASLVDTLTPADFPTTRTAGGGGAHFYWLRAINAGGNFSNIGGPVSATPSGVPDPEGGDE